MPLAGHAWQLAQINVGRLLAPIDDPMIADFKNSLDHVNAIAERSPGFVWRLIGDGNDATDLQIFDDATVIPNMSVWTDMDSLAGFVYRNTEHLSIMRRRREWFSHMQVYMALWWVPAGHRPSLREAREKLELIERLGPTPDAFVFKTPYPAPDGATIKPVLESCE